MYDVSGSNAWDGEKVKFEAGQGLWILGYGVSLNIPAPKLNN